MNRHLIKLAGGLLVGAAMLMALSACGGSAGGNTAVTAQPTATATPASTGTAAPVPTATATPVPASSTAPTPTPTAATPSGGAAGGDALAVGKLIFEKTAAGVGCAHCHGMDAKGNGPADVNAPNIRSKTEADVRAAISGGVPMMRGVKLTDEEIAAVTAYIHSLP